MQLPRLALALLCAAPAAAQEERTCSPSGAGACGGGEQEESSLLSVAAGRYRPYGDPALRTKAECTKLGILNLDGYYYPTQPGDVNDKRTWCTVRKEDVDNPHYGCVKTNITEGEFEVLFRTVKGFTFHESEQLNGTKHKAAFKEALREFLTDTSVCAITCSVGFCSGFQDVAKDAVNEIVQENIGAVRKPMILGTPGLLAAFAGQVYGNDKTYNFFDDVAKDRVIVLTSYYPVFADSGKALLQDVGVLPEDILSLMREKDKTAWQVWEGMVAMYLHLHYNLTLPDKIGSSALRLWSEILRTLKSEYGDVKLDQVQNMTRFTMTNTLPLGWNNQPGYIPVDVGGGFHNTWLTLQNYEDQLQNALLDLKQQGSTAKAIICESTEMPAHANSIRRRFKLPVWDVSTLGRCLMTAAKGRWFEKEANGTNIYTNLFNNPEFHDCLLDWYTPINGEQKLETKFGEQADGSLKFYENLEREELENLTCNGGRPQGYDKYPIGRLMDHYDPGLPYKVGQIAEVCKETLLCACPEAGSRGAGCPGACPGAGNCGGGPYGSQLTSPAGTLNYPCGTHGELCPSMAFVPPLLQTPDRYVNAANSFACNKKARSDDKGFADLAEVDAIALAYEAAGLSDGGAAGAADAEH